MGFLPEHDPRPIPVTVLGDTGNYLHRSVGLHIVLSRGLETLSHLTLALRRALERIA